MPSRPSCSLGAIGECHYRDLDLPRHRRQRFELRAYDLAGHASAPVIVGVDAERPLIPKY